jgi:hypothetical protein
MATEAEDRDDDKDEDEGKETAVAEKKDGEVEVRLSRKEKRSKRYDDLATERDQLRKDKESLEQQLQAQRVQEARVYEYARQTVQKPQPGEDPGKKEIENIRREQELIQATLRSDQKLGEQEIDAMKRRFYELEDKRMGSEIERRVAEKLAAQPKRDPGEDEARILLAEFPDVAQNQMAMTYARGLWYQMQAEGRPSTLATSRQAMQQAAVKFGLTNGHTPPASESQQARYGAIPAQGGQKQSDGTMRLSRDQQRIAMARYPTLSEEEAYAKWAQKFQAWDKANPAQ